jgi:hypothetical protein
MSDETKPSTESAPEGATETAPEAPTDFREYVKWRETGELPEKAEQPQPAAAEQAPPAKSAPQSGADEKPVAEDEDDVETDRTGRGSSRVRRIDRLTRENELLKQQLASMQPRPAVPEPPKAAEAPGEPKLHDYPSLEAYQKALTEFILDQREAQKKAEAQIAEAKSAEEKIQAAFSKSQKSARSLHPDYDEMIESVKAPEGPGVMDMRQAMLEDEAGGEILYYLAGHPEELKRIAAMTPHSAVREIGRLSATLAPPSAANGKPQPKLSSAPRPPAPLSRPSAGTSKKDILDEDFAREDFRGWSKAREAQLKG